MTALVVVVGSFNLDHVWTAGTLPRAGETLGGSYARGPGGKGFNQATAAARAGAPTALICALGDDGGGRMARELAAADGIDVHVQSSDAPTGAAGIFVDAEGRNTIVLGPGANAQLSAAHVCSLHAQIAASRLLLVQLEVPVAAVGEAMRIARDAQVTTILNPAPANAEVLEALLSLCDVLTPNESEFSQLIARHVGERVEPDEVSALDQPRLHALCRELLPHGSVVITLGASGCFVSHGSDLRGDERPHYRVPGERVDAVDTTGAGDAFNGALAASLALEADAPFAKQVQLATSFAALSTESAGAASSMPSRDEVAARFDQ
ncbi:MAG: ribokinase [Luteimonas sp.]